MVAPAGRLPWPQITSGLPRRTSYKIPGTAPPGPLRCGSTTCKEKAVAQAASNALPPRSRMPMPTAVAIQCVEVTTPKVPSISGRVVKRFGVTKFMKVPGLGQRPPELITVQHARQRPWPLSLVRHAGPCARHPRLETAEDVDSRDKPGPDADKKPPIPRPWGGLPARPR